MRSCKICGTDNCSKIMRIFHIIQDNKERCLTFFLCSCKNFIHGTIIISSNLRNHALVCMRLTELIKSLFAYIVNNGVCLSCLSRDRSYRTILTAIQNKKLVYAFARTESFQHRITSFYLFTHNMSSPIPIRTKVSIRV